MQVTEIITEKKKLLIHTDNGLCFPLYPKEAAQYQICEDSRIPDELWAQIRREVLDPRAKKRAMYLLEKMDRTEAQLHRKLRENGYPEEVVVCAMDYVKSFHYIDDYRYASVFIRSRQGAKSRMQLKMSLLQKGVAADLIEQALEEEYSEGEETLIRKLLEKKKYDPEQMDQQQKYKIYQSILRKGFSGSIVRNVMGL